VAYHKNGKPLAVASINRDAESLRVQVAMERGGRGRSRKPVFRDGKRINHSCPMTNATPDSGWFSGLKIGVEVLKR
jgi:hypothetical protein